MKAFMDVLAGEYGNDLRLGSPSSSVAQRSRRLTALAQLTGGRGFRIPAAEPRLRADGATRGDRKRALLAATNAKVSEVRKPQFMHSAERRRFYAEQAAA